MTAARREEHLGHTNGMSVAPDRDTALPLAVPMLTATAWAERIRLAAETQQLAFNGATSSRRMI